MKFNVGDVVDFTDSSSGFVYRGVLLDYIPGRDKRGEETNRPLREYLMKFDNLYYGYDRGWVAEEELTMVRSGKTSPTVTYTSSTWTNKPMDDNKNIKISASTTTKTVNDVPEYPWSPYYVTSDDFFDILKVAFDDTYGSKTRWHPEDMYLNVSSTLEIVANTLSNMANVKAGRPLRRVKEV